MNARKWLVLAAMAACTVASAASPKPSYAEARKITNAVTSTLSVVMLWDKRGDAERMQAIKAAMAVSNDAERVFGADPFGPWRYCLQMANRHAGLVQALNENGRKASRGDEIDPRKFYEAVAVAYNLGELYRSCRDQVETLDPPQK